MLPCDNFSSLKDDAAEAASGVAGAGDAATDTVKSAIQDKVTEVGFFLCCNLDVCNLLFNCVGNDCIEHCSLRGFFIIRFHI